MTDLNKVENLFKELGIGIKKEVNSDRTWITLYVGNELVDGYGGFFCSFTFNLAEKFIKVEIGE